MSAVCTFLFLHFYNNRDKWMTYIEAKIAEPFFYLLTLFPLR